MPGPPPPPPAIVALARERAAARARRDWLRADTLKADIEAAGWSIVDKAGSFVLRMAHRADEVRGGVLVHGESGSVPTMLSEPAAMSETVVVAAADRVSIASILDRLGPVEGDRQVVIVEPVADDAVPVRASAGAGVEIVRIAAPASTGAMINAGCRRAVGTIVVVAGVEAADDRAGIEAIVRALGDPTVAIAGSTGLISTDLRRFSVGTAEGSPDAVAVTGSLVAFRRADLVERGPLDERIVARSWLDVWWSLTLRDDAAGPPRRAVAVPIGSSFEAAGRDHDGDLRAARRDGYRVADRFAARAEILGLPGFESPPPRGSLEP